MPIHSSFLRYFDEVSKNSSIRKAAAKLHVASSAVNRQILKIEDELDTKLFKRSHDGICLTEAGQLLAQHVSRTLHDADRTLREISACSSRSSNGLKVVAQGSVISKFLPPVLMHLYAESPDITTSFMATGGKNLNEQLLNNVADIALIFDYQAEAGIELIDQISLPVGAVMSKDHPLAVVGVETLTMQECAAYSLILPDESWPLRDRLNQELAQSTIDLGSATTSNSMEFLRAMLAEKKVLGFQTIIGLETALDEGSLIHVPLLSINGDILAQTFSICISERSGHTDFLDRTLHLLKQRLKDYAIPHNNKQPS